MSMDLKTRSGELAEKAIFQTRWLLYPMALGLIVVLVMYLLKFSNECYNIILQGFKMEAEQIMVLMLGLVDMFMVANLLVMITQGSYHIFIHQFQFVEKGKKPQWLEHVDSSVLKVKIATSIAGITLIRVLKDFVNIEHVQWNVVIHRMWIHGLCLLSAITLAIIWRVLHPDGGHWNNNNHVEEEKHVQ
jgi:uncharacterized protein (TIGR00645 family)